MSSNETVEQIIDGKYKIEKQLGKGGMGTVYLATHIGTARSVAVKVIAPQFMQRQEFVERFRREARAAGRLRHPNVVDVTDFGFSVDETGAKNAYLVMEYLDGCTLGEVLDEEKNLPLEFTVDILEQVCSAVDEAHRQGIIHRDLKPDNIWLEPNQRGGYTVKVLDFGIAKLEENQESPVPYKSDEFLLSNAGKTQIESGKMTVAENAQSKTYVDKGQNTIADEGETLALTPEGETLALNNPSEAGTMVQEPAPDIVENDGNTQTDSAGNTELIKPNDEKRTRLVTGGAIMDDRPDPDIDTANLTRAGAVLGTPLYMSPEQCRGEQLTPASDIYSLAVIVYQMLSGKLPFNGDYVAVMEGHKNDAPPSLDARKVPKKLKGVVMRALSKDISERPKSAEALASKLRSNSEGLGVLVRRAVVMYGEHFPKILLLTLIAFLPILVLTFLKVGISFMFAAGIFENDVLNAGNQIGFGVLIFFIHTVMIACLIGMTTWVVGRVLAYPLRPISVRSAIREVMKRWKALAGIVTLSNLIALAGFLFCLLPGFWLSARFMMIAPSIMMEGSSGRAAFKRSAELYKRSAWTVLGVSLLNIIIPVIVAFIIGLSINSIIQNFERSKEIAEMKRNGVVAQKEDDKKVTVNVNQHGIVEEEIQTINPDGTVSKKNMRDSFAVALQEGIFELLWTPIALLITSFSAVLTALIYFKLRQAGGESLQNLLGKLEDEEHLQSKWQLRVRERLIQSGKITEGKTSSFG